MSERSQQGRNPLGVVAVSVGTVVRVVVEGSSESAAGTSLATKEEELGHDLQNVINSDDFDAKRRGGKA